LSDYRPISIGPFISKVLEKVVFEQLQTFLNDDSKSFNQGLKHCIVQKLPLQKFLMIFMITDSGESVILVMLDLSSVFDTVDHTILIFSP